MKTTPCQSHDKMSEKEEIYENNKLIYEFMSKKSPISDLLGKDFSPKNFIVLKYNNDYHWLMKVVEEIEKRGCCLEIYIGLATTCKIYYTLTRKTFSNERSTPIEAIYASVVEFIKYYNTKK